MMITLKLKYQQQRILNMLEDNNPYTELVQKLQVNRIWFLILGILLVVGGLFALSYTIIATVVAMYFIGGFIIAAGFIQLAHSLYAKQTTGVFLLSVIWSVIYLVAGICLFLVPLESALYLAFILAIFLIAFGVSRIIYGYQLRKMVGSSWIFLTGAVNILFGIFILAASPVSGIVFGVIMGIDLLMQGISFIMVYMAIRKDSLKA